MARSVPVSLFPQRRKVVSISFPWRHCAFAGKIPLEKISEIDSTEKIDCDFEPGQGAIMREGVSKVAVHRDSGGNVHKLSAVCPHLGCVVAWNSTEQTWDCPCHGSRFSAEGRVYNGPANGNLSSYSD